MPTSHFLTPAHPPLTNGNSLWGAAAGGEICGRNQFCPAHFLHRLRRRDKVTIRRVRKIKPNSSTWLGEPPKPTQSVEKAGILSQTGGEGGLFVEIFLDMIFLRSVHKCDETHYTKMCGVLIYIREAVKNVLAEFVR